ncbi:MAG: hypothetical protein DRI65_15105 [Chloroflexota bacterium]|nr:MAG: hypothetical protein DRI65_15105 [Chloroflexota bacterium]
MNIQTKLGASAFALCTLFASSAMATDAVVTETRIDTDTKGSWMGVYGNCYNVLPQGSGRQCYPEIEIGPDFVSTAPAEQYDNDRCEPEFADALCISGEATDKFDVRIFSTAPPTPGDPDSLNNHAFVWGFQEADVEAGTSQQNACQGQPGHSPDANYASTFDSDLFAFDPLSGEIKVLMGGDATIAYYFLSESTICRSQDYELFIEGDSVASGSIEDISHGKYVVFDIVGIPDGALVRLDTRDSETAAMCAPATGEAFNSHMSGIFVDGTRACAIPDEVGCRFTGGLNDVFENNHYRAGGQAGANTALPPQPKGEWTHRQQKGPAGKFTFHGGTASAPEGSEIDVIRCSDPGGCKPSGDKPSPAKQLDFDGIGTFKNIGKKNGGRIPDFVKDEGNTVMVGHGNKNFDGTFHWFEVNIDDLGEPGNTNPNKNPGDGTEACPANGFGEKGDQALANCDCSDFYRITIYDGVKASDVTKNPDGSIDKSEMNTTDVLYEVQGYIDGGNLQLHHLTGFDLK